MQIRNPKSTIRNSILRWYRRNGRDLPWRRTRNPYWVLVSEIMLQQTQASRVQEKYPQFLKRFPDFRTLARSRKSSVVRAWRGMGYNNRVIRLQRLAQVVMQEHGGRLPRTVEELQNLPGIGRYTAHAIACFAFGRNVPVVDTNVRRVLSRLLPRRKADIWEIAEEVLPARQAYDWNQALFDLGASVCTERKPNCEQCPVKKLCPSAFRAVRTLQKSSKHEPGRDGIPNRLYRGRIIETLRNLGGTRTIAAAQLGKKIKQNFSHRDSAWLHVLLRALERDGLVALKNGTSTVRVALAE